MKKNIILSIVLTLLMMFSLASCVEKSKKAPDGFVEAEGEVFSSEEVTTEKTMPVITEAQITAAQTEIITTDIPTAPPTEVPTTTQTETVTAEPVVSPNAQYRPKALMYHLILEEPYSHYEALFVRPSEFESHLAYMNELGYEYLFAEEWRMTDKPSVIITLDDGYLDNYTNMFPLIKKYNAKATVFLVTDLIGTEGYMNESQIKEMSDSGLVSFQCHTAHHNDLSYQTAEGLRADFTESVGIISGITGKPVRAIAYPAGSYNDTVLAVGEDFFDFAYTTKFPGNVPEYTSLNIPRYYMARGMSQGTVESYLRY